MLVYVNNLKKHFVLNRTFLGDSGCVKAVDGVSFGINRGETFALVGESGSGKTTVGRLVLGLLGPDSGEIRFDGEDILGLRRREMRGKRRKMQMIFQDPFGSLNPRMTVGGMLREILAFHNVVDRDLVEGRILELLRLVGLEPSCKSRYPHEFSGGERQRIAVARAVSLEPEFIVADEPVSALDVSIRGQILNLLIKLQEKLNLAYLFIAHDLAVVRSIAHRTGVMYLGKFLEVADTEELFTNPLHPYTRALLSSVPAADPGKKKRKPLLSGEVYDAPSGVAGCRFSSRCPRVKEECRRDAPGLVEVEENHFVACSRIQSADSRPSE